MLYQNGPEGRISRNDAKKQRETRLILSLRPLPALRETLILDTNMLNILQAESKKHITDARELFREYESWLGLDLCFQGFEDELRGLPGKYAEPDGKLLLAYQGDELAGCIAMRKLEQGVCEMKRLYVRDEFRGQKIGISLIEKVIGEARTIGYKRMRLDTFPPKMGKAVKLYASHGFVEISAYYDNPHQSVMFMEAAL